MRVFLDYDQAGLDRAYDQAEWAPNRQEVLARRAAASEAVRARLGEPRSFAYGPTAIERLDVYPTGALFRTEFGTVVVLPGAKIRGRRQQPRQGHHISSSSAGVDGQSRSTRRTRASSGSPATLYPHKGRDVAAMRWSSDSTHSARISTNLDHRMTRCTSCSAAPPS